MNAAVDTLVERLLAAIDETERIAREAIQETTGRWTSRETDWGGGPVVEDECGALILPTSRPGNVQWPHIARQDPHATLRRCAADRRILAAHPYEPNATLYVPSLSVEEPSFFCHTCHFGGMNDVAPTSWGVYCATLLALAEGYGITTEETDHG